MPSSSRSRARFYPQSWQRVVTNGNYDYATKLQGQFLDEIIVSCDGIFQENYEKYRRGGSVQKALKFMNDAASREQDRIPMVVWKYILFEFNDSDEETQTFALERELNILMLTITDTQFRSQRFTIDNLMDLRILAPTAQIEVTPRFLRNNVIDQNPSGNLKSIDRRGGPVTLRRLESDCTTATLCNVDHIHLFASDVMTLNGWAVSLDTSDPIVQINITEDDRALGSVFMGIPRPDVLDHHPSLMNRRAGFAMGARRTRDLHENARHTRTAMGLEDHHAFEPLL